ncbi:hypothetical protein EDD22DRAFT_954204 [Suillus occidentalis]|nr:hypothetical protein EDD22DRAFT_954204 [Suillus occidentalis]
MSLPRMWWVDRKRWMKMLYRGKKVHIDNLREIFTSMETKLVDLWENRVLGGVNICICYENIVDNTSNNDVGYCFSSDCRNTCFADRNCFLKALIDDPEAFSRFTVIRQGQLTRSQCNLVMLGKNLTMLRMYHKGTALSGTDKLIPHSIDGVMADIMIQDLTLTRPFAEVAAHICYPDKPLIKESYQTQIFVNNHKLFTTDQLSTTMARESMDRLGFHLGINSWHHISTAFKCKLGQFAEELWEEDGEDTIEVLQASHSRTTENHIYGLSPDTLAGGAEDLLPQFLQASTNWQLLMHTIPGGLQLPYLNARGHHFKELAESGKFSSDFEDSASDSRTSIALSALKASRFKKEIHLNMDEMADHCRASHVPGLAIPSRTSLYCSLHPPSY